MPRAANKKTDAPTGRRPRPATPKHVPVRLVHPPQRAPHPSPLASHTHNRHRGEGAFCM